MFILTGFGDEISPELDKQTEFFNREKITHLELRGVFGKNILDLTDEEAVTVKTKLQKSGIKISAIGSPIGKVSISDPFEPHLVRFNRAIELAKFFGTRYIRIFSYYNPQKIEQSQYRTEVMSRMKTKTQLAEKAGIILLHENESGIYGNTADRCKDMLDTVNSKFLQAIFDPANFVVEKQKPYDDCYNKLVDYTVYLHIKDAVAGDPARIVPAGEGDGQVKQILSALKTRNFTGFLSLEPHLIHAGAYSGFSGDVLFKKAVDALIKILKEINAEYC
jgi:sugar phosphate isomerase/epimerase